MSSKSERKQGAINGDPQLEPPRKHESENTEQATYEMDIDPANEVKGVKLLLVHAGICLCTFLIGLVGLGIKRELAKQLNTRKDFNLIATAIPDITSEFRSVGDVGWYGSAFYIALWVISAY